MNNSRFFRLTASVATLALLANAVAPVSAVAQGAPPPAAPAQPPQTQGDPPARVGRISAATGTVSFRTADDTQWSPASVNYPVSTGNAFWADTNSTARLEIGSSHVVLAPLTELDVNLLDFSGLQATVPQGETYVHLISLAPNETWTVETPRGTVRLTQAGRYGIQIGSTEAPTLVTVLDGSAQIEAPNVSLTVGANETATIEGTDTFNGRVGPAVRDPFLTQQLAAEQPPPPPASVPSGIVTQVAQMPGGTDLYTTGSWAQTPSYGQVWYPPVQQGWVPYREGHWAYVAPWGWTWVDNAPWGFAPFHYGRWVEINNRWAWTPGVVPVTGPAVYTPVYAPALVTFLGAAAGVAAGAAVGAALAGGSIGWIPLGPREPFHPWYPASRGYFQRINVSHVTNINNIRNTTINNVTINTFTNRGAATMVPASVMTGSRPVQAAFHPVPQQQLARLHPIVGQSPLRPVATTSGVTPAVARRLALRPAAPGSVRQVPGPAVQPHGFAVGPNAHPQRPPVPAASGARPVPAAAGAAAVPHPPGQAPGQQEPGQQGPGRQGPGQEGSARRPGETNPRTGPEQ
ncbi:DUF6600 domain-containing protein, partial [Rhodopila sp.]|uniref:DUF6600 domain-containing protein n=1 Tax=Rhodopila sp. TaxID=2480087 RepID=UPI002C5B7218